MKGKPDTIRQNKRSIRNEAEEAKQKKRKDPPKLADK